VMALANALQPDQIQLFYTIAVHSRQELSLAPDAYAGFVMACLRMLALGAGPDAATASPAGTETQEAAGVAIQTAGTVHQSGAQDTNRSRDRNNGETLQHNSPPSTTEARNAGTGSTLAAQHGADATTLTAGAPSTPAPSATPAPASKPDVPAWEDDIPDDSTAADHAHAFEDIPDDAEAASMTAQPRHAAGAYDDFSLPELPRSAPPSKTSDATDDLHAMTRERWPALAAKLPVTGMAAELARQSEWVGGSGSKICLRVAVHSLAQTQGKTRLRTVLSEHFGVAVDLQIEFGTTGDDTAHAVAQAAAVARRQRAEQSAQSDPFVQTLMRDFGAQFVPGSIQAAPAP